MTPEQKSKLIKLAIGALVAGAMAAIAYFSNGLKDVFSGIPFGAAVGLTAALVTKVLWG